MSKFSRSPFLAPQKGKRAHVRPNHGMSWIDKVTHGSDTFVRTSRPSPREGYSYYENKKGQISLVRDADAVGSFRIRDSGQVSNYRPAKTTSPEKVSFWNKITRWARREKMLPDTKSTSQLGSLAAASPATYFMGLLQQRYDRQLAIPDMRQLILDDPRAYKSTKMWAHEACRSGASIFVTHQEKNDIDAQLAEAVADRLMRVILTPKKLESWAWMLIVEGDLFVQPIIDPSTNTIVSGRRLPAVGMERNTDDSDDFVDVTKAFSQVDVVTQREVATFPEMSICHVRHNYIDGDRYGMSELASARRMSHVMAVMEEAQVVRRLSNSNRIMIWNIGTEQYPGTDHDVASFKSQNGFIEGQAQTFDPIEQSKNFFSNGMVSGQSVPSDQNIDRIDDINYYNQVFMTSLPTPGILYGMGSGDVSGEVLEQVRSEWLKSTVELNEEMNEVIRFFFELELLLRGINPAHISYSINWSKSTTQSTREIVDYVCDLHTNGFLSQRTGVALVKEFTNVQDIDAEIDEINEERMRIKQEDAQIESDSEPDGPPDKSSPNAALVAPKNKTRGSAKATTPQLRNRFRKGGRQPREPYDTSTRTK